MKRAMSAVVLALAAGLVGCSGKPVPPTLTVRNDAMLGVDVHYAVLGVDGNPAVAGEGGVGHLSVGAGGAATQTIEDPTGALGKIPRGQTAVRAFVTMAGGGPETAQVVDLSMPPPFVVRVSPMGAGFKAERAEEQAPDDRQYREITTQPPPQPGRASRP